MADRKGPIWIRVEIDPAFRRALREAPQTVQERLRSALRDAMGIMRESVQQQIRSAGLIRSGRMLQATRVSVSRRSRGDWTGRLRVRRFYGRFHNTGATTVLQKDVRFPISDVIEVTQIGERQLKRARYERINVRWVTLKAGTVIRSPATHFFDRGVESEEERVLSEFQLALRQALQQEFGR